VVTLTGFGRRGGGAGFDQALQGLNLPQRGGEFLVLQGRIGPSSQQQRAREGQRGHRQRPAACGAGWK
jgi:hypothetical protein